MNWSKKKNETVNETNSVPIKASKEEWVWVDGYKGTDKNMTCRDTTYEIGRQYDYDGIVSPCVGGYHLCLKLDHVFEYYDVENGNRFFKVRALVKKNNLETYNDNDYDVWGDRRHKLAAKSIVFEEEVTSEEIFTQTEKYNGVLPEWWDKVREYGFYGARRYFEIQELIACGFSEQLAEYIYSNKRAELAKALVSQEGLEMKDIIQLVLTAN